MAKSLKDIFTEIASDNACINKLASMKTKEEITEYINSFGAETTSEKIANYLLSKQAGHEELSDDELVNVAGGYSSTPSRLEELDMELLKKMLSCAPDHDVFNL